jgi:hypothetical protein
MTGCKLRRGVNWQGTFKHKGVKQTSVQEELGVHSKVSCFRPYNFIQTIQHTHVLKGSLLGEVQTVLWFLFLCERC